MSPETIPWLLCGSICILPALIGTGVYFAWVTFTNRLPSRDISNYVDADGRKHTVTDWSMITRQEKNFRTQPEEKE
jgi:hypothetical protein